MNTPSPLRFSLPPDHWIAGASRASVPPVAAMADIDRWAAVTVRMGAST